MIDKAFDDVPLIDVVKQLEHNNERQSIKKHQITTFTLL